MSALADLAARLAAHPHVTGKRAVGVACAGLGLTRESPGRPGDDAAALPDGAGWQLMATEGFMNEWVASAPWFAGWCALMVNVSDIAAMGGRPTALTNALWARDAEQAAAILKGMREASAAYGVPIVGGHTNLSTDRPQLAATIWGRATALITSFDARPGEVLIAAVDHRGAYAPERAQLPAFLNAPFERLRGDLELLPRLAEAGLVRAGKDISQGGIVGTALMLGECSGVGIEIAPGDIPLPASAPLERWMIAFPSFGFLLTALPADAPRVCAHFQARDVVAAPIGRVTAGSALSLVVDSERAVIWDYAKTPYLGLGVSPAPAPGLAPAHA